MRKYIENIADNEITEFAYFNKDGDTECVTLDCDSVTIVDDSYDNVHIYYEDIPKLISALEMAKTLKEKRDAK